jgi:hypothetical protein
MSAAKLPTHDVFLDFETGGLRHHDTAWEVGMVVEAPGRDLEMHHYYVSDFNPADADPKALEFGGFYDRHPLFKLTDVGQPAEPGSAMTFDDHGLITDPDGAQPHVHFAVMPEALLMRHLSAYLRNARLCIVNPAYDKPILESALCRAGLALTSYYTPVSIGDFAAGVLGIDPCAGSSSRIAEALGVSRDSQGLAHTGLADAMYARAVLRAAEERANVMPHWMAEHAAQAGTDPSVEV